MQPTKLPLSAENSVRFGIGFQIGQILGGFISKCEIRHTGIWHILSILYQLIIFFLKAYMEEVYPQIRENLNVIGKIATEKIHPWVLNTLIDWDSFDKVMCKVSMEVEEGIYHMSHIVRKPVLPHATRRRSTCPSAKTD